MFRITIIMACLLAAQVYGAPTNIVRFSLGSSKPSLKTRMTETAYEILERRQAVSVPVNTTQWDSDTLAACTATLSTLSAASNPAGVMACYNLMQLDTNSGAFKADLRLFQVSAPSKAWEGIGPQRMQGRVAFAGATASEVNGQAVNNTRSKRLVRRQASGPTLLRTYTIVGQINQDQVDPPMVLQKIEPLVIPTITLSAKNAKGQIVTTNVSVNEAVFVNGIFSKEAILSRFNMATLAVQNATAELKAGEVAFVLPGVNILIFPIGLVMTSFWTVVGVGAYSFGTYERYQHRESYRRRKAMAEARNPYPVRI
ncbi:hypothetical protein F4861DRAFT_140335 [Xylaria intraflava]|nr:hypothetical protein F4861DRAFT_140335 [Xylaria intraflava]